MSNDLEGLGAETSAGRHLNGRQLGAAAICRQDPSLALYGLLGGCGLPRLPLRRVTRSIQPRCVPPRSRRQAGLPRSRHAGEPAAAEPGRAELRIRSGCTDGSRLASLCGRQNCNAFLLPPGCGQEEESFVGAWLCSWACGGATGSPVRAIGLSLAFPPGIGAL